MYLKFIIYKLKFNVLYVNLYGGSMPKQSTLNREEVDFFQQIKELVDEKVQAKIHEEKHLRHKIKDKVLIEKECADALFHKMEAPLLQTMQNVELFHDHLEKQHPELFSQIKHHFQKEIEELKKIRSFHQIVEYGKKKKMSPALLNKVYEVGANHCTARNLDNAFLCFTWLCLFNPQNPKVWFMKGVIEQNLKKYPDALLSYYQTLSLNADFINVYTQLMNCLILMGDLTTAKNIYKKFTHEVDPKTYAHDEGFCENMKCIKEILK